MKIRIMFSRIRPFIGLALVIVSIAALFYWEKYGREEFTMTEVLVTNQLVEEDTYITVDMLSSRFVPNDAVIDGAYTPESAASLIGKKASTAIQKNSQVSTINFTSDEEMLSEERSLFVIKSYWIAMRSSSLRAGDKVAIYSSDGSLYFGTYDTAFVKDSNEMEVTAEDGGKSPDDPAKRTSLSRSPDHIEILASLGEYLSIYDYAENNYGTLIIVQVTG